MEKDKINQYLSFKVDNEHYALDVQSVREVLEVCEITRIPRMPEYMKGVINIRGSVVPVIGLRKKFDLPEVDQTVNSSIVVVELKREDQVALVGLMTDTVEAVLDFPQSEIQPPPQMGLAIDHSLIEGMAYLNETFLIILDLEQLLLKEELDEISQKIPVA